MKDFQNRRDRFEFFESFEKPQLNICFELEVEDLRSYCKANNLPVFHTFLWAVVRGLDEVRNFKYRIYRGEVIEIEKITPSYTVMNQNQVFNFTRFSDHPDLKNFVAASVAAGEKASRTAELVNDGLGVGEREMKDHVFVTCLPWLKFTSIEHPVFRFKSADIPSIAWGKFTPAADGKLLVPFAVQAHHGFVDGFHIHLLGESVKKTISGLLAGSNP